MSVIRPIHPPATAPTLTTTPLYDGVGLTWQPVPGATSYDIYSTPTPETSFGSSPIGQAPANATTFVADGIDPDSDQYFAISSIINGQPVMMHPLTEGKSASNSTEPVTQVNATTTGCSTPVNVNVSFVDGFDDLTAWTYTIGSNPPVTQSLSGRSQNETITVPVSSIVRGDILAIQGTDTRGPGPVWTERLGGNCKYVALGDSYSAGEGAGDYDVASSSLSHFLVSNDSYSSGSIWGGDPRCHRSTDSYANIIANEYFGGKVTLRACSGAVSQNVSDFGGAPAVLQYLDEKPQQITSLDSNTSFVTISTGGNVSGFATIIKNCLIDGNCDNDYQKGIDLDGEEPKLVALYQEIKADAPNATIVIVGYPQIMPDIEAGQSGACWRPGGHTLFGTLGMTDTEIEFVRRLYADGDTMIKAAAEKAGVNYANVENAFDGHLTCSSDPAANGITVAYPVGYGGSIAESPTSLNVGNWLVQTAHPNALGYQLEAPIVAKFIGQGNPAPADPGPPTWTSGSDQLSKANITTQSGSLSAVRNWSSGRGSVLCQRWGIPSRQVVKLLVHSTAEDLGSFVADANGDVTATATVPSDLASGFHLFTLSGPTPSGDTQLAEVGAWVGVQPQPVTQLTASPSDGQVTLAWNPPSDTGGTPLLGFNITAQPGDLQWLALPGATTAPLAGLTNGTAYTFSVSAVSGWGASDPSTVVSTPTSAPSPLEIVTESVTSGVIGEELDDEAFAATEVRSPTPGQ